MQQDIKDAVITAWTSAWDDGDVDALDAITTDDYVRERTSTNATLTLDEHKNEIRAVRDAFPDLRTTVDRILVDGDDAAIFWTSIGTFTEPLHGVPPTGRRVETRGSNRITLRDGRIARERITWDSSALLADLGVPSLGSAFEIDESVVVDDLSGVLPVEAIKGFNRQFVTGVTVVTAVGDDGVPRGLAANSYASVSIDPPLVLVCVQKTSSTYDTLFRATHLGINIIANEQLDTVRTFASKTPDKFEGLDWHEGPNGAPLIDGSAASLEAEIKERFQAKTHTVFIGRVRYAEVAEVEPMVYKAGRFYSGEHLESL